MSPFRVGHNVIARAQTEFCSQLGSNLNEVLRAFRLESPFAMRSEILFWTQQFLVN